LCFTVSDAGLSFDYLKTLYLPYIVMLQTEGCLVDIELKVNLYERLGWGTEKKFAFRYL